MLRDSLDSKVEITVNDINIKSENLAANISFVDGCFESTDIAENHYDIVYSSHVIEHILNYDDHVRQVRKILRKGGKVVISLPNFELWIGRKYLNAFTQEHTVYPLKADICNLFTKNGFELEASQDYLDHSLFLCFSYTGEVESTGSARCDVERRIEFLTDYVGYLEKLKEFLRSESEGYNVHIFGANSSCQVILSILGEDYARKVKNIYDNSPLKQGRYLFGHDLRIENPDNITSLSSNDLVLVFVGAFDDEIERQIRSLNNRVRILSRKDLDISQIQR